MVTRPEPPAVGVLGLQGGVAEHAQMLTSLGAKARRVRRPSDLEGLQALVLPGGESTTIDRLIRAFGLRQPLIDFARAGRPILGTCAGLILLSREICDPAPGQQSLGVLDIKVARNAFGPQTDSAEVLIPWDDAEAGTAAVVRAALIRAPEVIQCGPDVQVTSRYEGRVVGVRQGNLLGLSFHPELTGDLTVHAALLELVSDDEL